METGITKNLILAETTKSPHGKLEEYLPVCQQAAKQEADFFGHLIAYNQKRGQIRDAKQAFPVISLSVPSFNDPELVSNSLAHLALLAPRELVKALEFAKKIKTPGHGSQLYWLRRHYLEYRENNWQQWVHDVVQDRESIQRLYQMPFHTARVGDKKTGRVPIGQAAKTILYDRNYAPGSVFAAIRDLKKMSVLEAAAAINHFKLPWLAVKVALQERLKEPDLLVAVIDRMSPSEFTSNQVELERLGVMKIPAARAAYDQALERAKTSKKVTLKTTQAAEASEKSGKSKLSEEAQQKLKGLQEKQLKHLSIEGRWAVLSDASGSMAQCIEASRHIAGSLAKMVSQAVSLIFFSTSPRFMDVTGKDYSEILKMTRGVTAGGGTSIGCGLQYLMDKKIEVDGITVVSDCYENTNPLFVDRYQQYCKMFGKEPPIYIYSYAAKLSSRLGGDTDLRRTLSAAGIEYQEFEMYKGETDYYAIPALVQTMRVNRYSLLDEIYETPLLDVAKVLKYEKEEYTHA